jgi:hypothetical protein
MSDEEAFAYLAWVSGKLVDKLRSMDETGAVAILGAHISRMCSDNYRAAKTGRFDAPTADLQRFDSPQALEKAMAEAEAEAEAPKVPGRPSLSNELHDPRAHAQYL